MFKKFQALGKVIDSVKPKVNKTKLDKAKSNLNIAIQKTDKILRKNKKDGGRMGLKKGSFPDHSGDGKITKKDILMAKLCAKGKAAAKRKFKVYPSAYANMYASGVCSGKIKPGGRKKAMGGE